MMPRVVGIDPSLSCTGLGVITQRSSGSTLASTSHVKSTPLPGPKKRAKLGLPPKATLTERRDRMREVAESVLRVARGADLVVIEETVTGPSGAGASRTDLMALWWQLVGPLVRAGAPVAVVVGSSLKLAITGNGRADKGAMSAAVVGLWPDVTIEVDDEGDALGLAHLGAVALGWDVPTLKRHHGVKWQEWPTLPDPSAVPA